MRKRWDETGRVRTSREEREGFLGLPEAGEGEDPASDVLQI
jgi:hypothetical protein